MKKSVLLALASVFVCFGARADLFNSIQFWVGSGTNEAAFEIDWNNGASNAAKIWGYRWNGPATGGQMLDAIVAADPRLYAEVSGSSPYGPALFGLGFQVSGDGDFPLSPSLSFDSEHLAYTNYDGVDDNRTVVDAGDFWQEGWYTAGYWSYWLSTDSRLSTNYSDWDYSDVGMTDRVLANGDVDGWSFSYNFEDSTPAVPIPASSFSGPEIGAALGVGTFALAGLRKKRQAKKIAAAALFPIVFTLSAGKVQAISLDDIQLWTGSGTNRAALIVEWSAPQSLTNSTVPAPMADKTLVWGYRFDGTATATEMLNAVIATDPKLYVVENDTNGTVVEAIGYNLNANGVIGITDGTHTNDITNGILTTATANLDAATAINNGDLYWGGVNGPKWELWNETNDAGGFLSSPNRGTNTYWTAANTNFTAGYHGQWAFAQTNLDHLPLTNGSWIGFSVAAGESESAANAPYNVAKHAPVSPDGTYAAYICNTNDFAVQIVSSNNIYSKTTFGQTFYTNVLAVLGRPTLKFKNGASFYGDGTIHRVKINEPAFWTDPSSNDVITEINVGGQITVNMGHKIYHNPNHPYGIDFNVFGNSFYPANGGLGTSGLVSDSSDEGSVTFNGSPGTYGHTTLVSVSQDGTNWFTYPEVPVLVPDDAYRWDDTNHCWTDEQMNETKPLNPALNFPADTTVANALDQFVGAYGGSGYSLEASGFPWIQYVRINAGVSLTDNNSGDYTVIDAVGAVNPVTVGDALSITPANLSSGVTNLVFQNPANPDQTLIALNFDSVSTNARISTVSLHEFSAFAPVIGNVSSAYQLQARTFPPDTSTLTLQVDLGLSVSTNYAGQGNDLRVYQWNDTHWISQPFTFNPANHQVLVAGVTNLSAFVVSQIVPPQLNLHAVANGFAFQFTPVANCAHILERSTDLITWTPIFTNPPASSSPVIFQDTNAPAGNAFYRLLLNP